MSSNKRKQHKPQRSLEQCKLDESTIKSEADGISQRMRRSSRIVNKKLAKSQTHPVTLKSKNKPQTPSKKINSKKTFQNNSKKCKAIDETVLNVDLLRRLPVTELVNKYAVHTTKEIPKDESSTIIQHEYSCQMMPQNCREIFCGSASDTKEQIRRHLLRHIGELLTLTNIDPDSKKAKNSINITTVKRQPSEIPESSMSSKKIAKSQEGESEEENDIRKHGRRSQRILEKVLQHDGKSHDDQFTIIHSDEGVNELVLLPKGKLINLSNASETSNNMDEVSNQIPLKQVPVENSEHSSLEQSINELNSSVSNLVELPREAVKLGRPPKLLERNILLDNREVALIEELTVENYLSEEIDADKIGAEIVVQTYMQTADDMFAAMEIIPYNPPHMDHLYALLPCKPLPGALHTDSSGVPILEPEQSDEECPDRSQELIEENIEEDGIVGKPSTDIDSVEIVTDFDMNSVCQEFDLAKGKKRRKEDPQFTVINYEIFQHLTPDERRIRKQALELLYQSRKRSRIKKGELLKCEICGKMLTAFGTLRAHYRSHAGIKPYSCKVCSATFTRLHSLKYHMMIHNDQSRFTCEHCGREFRHASHFREHLRRHTGEEPFGCTECSARFKTRNTYKRHLYAKHGKVLKTDGIHLAKFHQKINNVHNNGIKENQTLDEKYAQENKQATAILLPEHPELVNLPQIPKDNQDKSSHDETEDIASCLASLSEITNPLRDMEGNIRILLIN